MIEVYTLLRIKRCTAAILFNDRLMAHGVFLDRLSGTNRNSAAGNSRTWPAANGELRSGDRKCGFWSLRTRSTGLKTDARRMFLYPFVPLFLTIWLKFYFGCAVILRSLFWMRVGEIRHLMAPATYPLNWIFSTTFPFSHYWGF